MSKEEELPNPGLSVTFLVRIEDVTARVLGKTNPDMTEAARREAIQARKRRHHGRSNQGNPLQRPRRSILQRKPVFPACI